MTLTGAHLIDGQWVSSATTFTVTSPASGAPLAPAFGEATAQNVDAAAAAAARAADLALDLDPRWPATLLDAIAAAVMDLGDALLERGEAETALPRARLTGERGRTVGQLKMFAQFVRDGAWVDATIDPADPARQPAPKPDLRRMLRPRGPVAVFGASNFPFAFSTVGGDTASALAAGNPVIVKGHPSHPGTSEMFASAVLAAIKLLGLPTGLFGLLQGKSHELSGALVKHPAIAAVGFTGSRKAGRALFDLAAARPQPIPVYAEMGSLNPLIILPGAIHERAEGIAKDLAGSVLLGGGQFCTKPGVILAIGDASVLVDALAKTMTASAASGVTMLNQPLRDTFIARVTEWSRLPGVTARMLSTATGFAGATPSLFEATVDIFRADAQLHEEAFGPAALVVHCASHADAAAALRAVGGSLTGTIHTGSTDDARPLLRALEGYVGRVILNGYPTGVEVGHAMVHGGPYPATTDPNSTSVGTAAPRRFTRMIAYQNTPDALLRPALQNANPLGIARMVNGKMTTGAVA